MDVQKSENWFHRVSLEFWVGMTGWMNTGFYVDVLR